MFKLISISILLLFLAVPASADTITVPVNEIISIDPVIIDGQPDPSAIMLYSAEGIEFLNTTYDITDTWGLFQEVSMVAFGNPNAQVLIWDKNMSLIGCAWFENNCVGGVAFGSSGVTGKGTLVSTPKLALMTIYSLTFNDSPVAIPEPSTMLLLGLGASLLALTRRRSALA
jgi:PEP-CTERM motif-containing protein